MSQWSAKTFPLPDKNDSFKMKDFFKAKYIDKRFAPSKDSDSDDDSHKKKKKKKSKRKKSSSSESDEKPAKPKHEEAKAKPVFDSDSDSEQKVTKAATVKRRLGAPPTGVKADPMPQPSRPAQQSRPPVESLLEFGGPSNQQSSDNDNGWAAWDDGFASSNPVQPVQQPVQQQILQPVTQAQKQQTVEPVKPAESLLSQLYDPPQ